VNTGAGRIKTGSLCGSERITKYNRLLAFVEMAPKRMRGDGPLSGTDILGT